MKAKVLHNKIARMIFALALMLVTAFSFLLPAVKTASAAETSTSIYTNVMDDLQKDETFNVADYPVIEDDYSLDVIQIAESSDGELFVYVYQPSHPNKDLIATSIRLSMPSVGEESSYNDYPLTLLNSYDVFDKYKVENVEVKADSVRYYEIVQLTRLWDASIDEPTGNDNTVLDIVFSVGQFWTVSSVNNNIFYSMEKVETVKITSKFLGFLRYPSNSFNFHLGYDCFDVHYLAFSTDKPIDKILEIELEYNIQDFYYDSFYCYGFADPECYGSIKTEKIALKAEENIILSGSGWFSLDYNWNAIESVSSFLDNEHVEYSYEHGVFNSYVSTKLTEESKKGLQEKEWVLRFAVTEFGTWENGKGDWQKMWWSIVSDTTILRIKFDMNGEIYNLGVVDNHQTGGKNPSNEVEITIKPNDDFWWLSLIVGLLLLAILSPILIPLIELVIKILSKLLSLLWTIISAPFKLLGKLFKKKPFSSGERL